MEAGGNGSAAHSREPESGRELPSSVFMSLYDPLQASEPKNFNMRSLIHSPFLCLKSSSSGGSSELRDFTDFHYCFTVSPSLAPLYTRALSRRRQGGNNDGMQQVRSFTKAAGPSALRMI